MRKLFAVATSLVIATAWIGVAQETPSEISRKVKSSTLSLPSVSSPYRSTGRTVDAPVVPAGKVYIQLNARKKEIGRYTSGQAMAGRNCLKISCPPEFDKEAVCWQCRPMPEKPKTDPKLVSADRPATPGTVVPSSKVSGQPAPVGVTPTGTTSGRIKQIKAQLEETPSDYDREKIEDTPKPYPK
jgi:hypothetical protein